MRFIDPGDTVVPMREGANYLCLSFGYLSAAEIVEGLAVLSDVLA